MREVKYRLRGTRTSEARCEKCCRRIWTARASVSSKIKKEVDHKKMKETSSEGQSVGKSEKSSK